MNRKLAFALALGAVAMFAQQASAPNPNFTGNITRLKEDPPGQITYIRFEAGARTKWHIHEKGQIVFVEEGVGLEQQKGGPVREVPAGCGALARRGAGSGGDSIQHHARRNHVARSGDGSGVQREAGPATIALA